MRKFLRLGAFILAMLLMVCSFTACKDEDKKEEEKEEDKTFTTAEKNPEGSAVVDKDLQFGDFYYATYEDNTVTITNYAGESENVKVPIEIDGKTVMTIGEGAFYNKASVKSLEIPQSVKYYEK